MKSRYTWEELRMIRERLRTEGKKVVFTNGVFDLMHAGHVDYLTKARALGDVLIVGLNADESVRRIKGDTRPITPESERSVVLSSMKPVDYVALFHEETPYELIKTLAPDILIKGGDWAIENVVGKDIVEEAGGEVKTIPFVHEQSTSRIIETITERFCEQRRNK